MSVVAESLGRIMLPWERINVEHGCNDYAYDYHGDRGRFHSQCDLLENMSYFHAKSLPIAVTRGYIPPPLQRMQAAAGS